MKVMLLPSRLPWEPVKVIPKGGIIYPNSL
jgi:hypothetical protein